MGSLSIWHWMIVLVVGLLLFGGRSKISDLMGDVAKGIKAFKKGMADEVVDAPPKAETPVKTLDHQAPAPVNTRVEAGNKVEGTLS